MKTLKRKQTETLNTIQAQAYCMCASCGGHCSCYGQPDNVWQQTYQNTINSSKSSSSFSSSF